MDRNFYGIKKEESTYRIPIIQYMVSFYRGVITEETILFTTPVSLFMGDVLCLGYLSIDHVFTEIILYLIMDNETTRIPAVRIIEYLTDEDVMILMERTEYV